jgi:hypothetical protein
MAKDFTGINTGRVIAGLEQATSRRGQQPAITQQEAEQRAAEMRTQGRAGAKMPRINMAFTPENHQFIKIMSTIRGESMTQFVNFIFDQYREEHPEIYQDAKAIIDRMG